MISEFSREQNVQTHFSFLFFRPPKPKTTTTFYAPISHNFHCWKTITTPHTTHNNTTAAEMLLYRFRSNVEYKRVPLDRVDNVKETAMFVRAHDVKKAIVVAMMGSRFVAQNKLGDESGGNCGVAVFEDKLSHRRRIRQLERQDFELKMYNAKTGEEYVDDTKFIPTTSSADISQRLNEGRIGNANEMYLSSDDQNNVLLIIERCPVPPGRNGILVRLATKGCSGNNGTSYNSISSYIAESALNKPSPYVIENGPDAEDEYYYVDHDGDDGLDESKSSSSLCQHSYLVEAQRSSYKDTRDDKDQDVDVTVSQNSPAIVPSRNPGLTRVMNCLLERSSEKAETATPVSSSSRSEFGPVNNPRGKNNSTSSTVEKAA
jgi:DWNN domain